MSTSTKRSREVELIPIARIQIGERRREKLGPIASLAKDIDEHDLTHPIVVTDGNLLVVGRRRLAACERIGWKSIPARRFASLSEEELRALELGENVHRLDLSSFDEARVVVAQGKDGAAEEKLLTQDVSKRGRPKGGNRAAGRATGKSFETHRRAEQQVETATTYPFMQGREWKQSHVLDARDALKTIPKTALPTIVTIASEPGISPKQVVGMIEHYAEMKPTDRYEVQKLYRDEDPGKKRLAKTRLARRPPSPPAHMMLVVSAHERWRTVIPRIPKKYRGLAKDAELIMRDLLRLMDKDYEDFKQKEMNRAT